MIWSFFCDLLIVDFSVNLYALILSFDVHEYRCWIDKICGCLMIRWEYKCLICDIWSDKIHIVHGWYFTIHFGAVET